MFQLHVFLCPFVWVQKSAAGVKNTDSLVKSNLQSPPLRHLFQQNLKAFHDSSSKMLQITAPNGCWSFDFHISSQNLHIF